MCRPCPQWKSPLRRAVAAPAAGLHLIGESAVQADPIGLMMYSITTDEPREPTSHHQAAGAAGFTLNQLLGTS
jgi:hypothetical protein